MNEGAAGKGPRPLVSVDVLIAGSIRDQAFAVMTWANALRRAELAGDWAEVAKVRADVAECAQGLACFASDLEERATRGRR